MTPDEIEQIITNLTERLGPSARHLYELALRQVYINVISWGIVGLLMLIGGIVLFRWAWSRPNDGLDMYPIEKVFGSCIGVIAAGLAVFILVDNLTSLLNPEWYAIKNLGGLWPQ